MEHCLTLDDGPHHVWLARRKTGDVLLCDGRELALPQAGDAIVIADGDDVHIHHAGRAYVVRYQHVLQTVAGEGGGGAADAARAPMPGSVVAVPAPAGAVVAMGDVLMVIESMKMETAIRATRDGTVQAVHFEVGQTFDRDAILLSLVPEEA